MRRRCLLALSLVFALAAPAAAAECAALPEAAFELSGHHYVIPERTFSPDDDMTAEIRDTYGPEARLVDWNDLKASLSGPDLISEFVGLSGIPNQTANECDNIYVSVGGRLTHEGYRYFFARHDRQPRPDWLVLDTIGSGTLDLGRWNHPSRALIELPSAAAPPRIVARGPAPSAQAEAAAPAPAAAVDLGRRVALVIANADYPGASLQNPTVDADLLEPVLKQMGFGVTVVKNADLQTFALALESFYAEAKGADLALFYFAGHGFAVNGQLGAENYLMSTSADVTSGLDVVIRSGGISLDEIVASIAGVARVSLVFVDACRNDPRVSRGGRGGRGLARIADVGTGETFVGLSTRLGDLAEDGEPGGGSPFARAFAANIPTPDLPIDEAFRKLRLAVVDETDGRQRPEARDDLNTPIVLSSSGGASASPSAAPPAASPAPNPPSAEPPAPQPNQEVSVAVPDQPSPGPAQRAIYYDQGTGDRPGSASSGTVTWAEITKDGQPAVEATIVIPDRGNATLKITLSKNRDAVLPASHLIELEFSGALSDASIDRVPALVLKPTEQDHGNPLAGAAVRVVDNLFLIALSNEPADATRNLELLAENPWFDVPVLFSDERRALITFEKGDAGTRILETTLAAWAR